MPQRHIALNLNALTETLNLSKRVLSKKSKTPKPLSPEPEKRRPDNKTPVCEDEDMAPSMVEKSRPPGFAVAFWVEA